MMMTDRQLAGVSTLGSLVLGLAVILTWGGHGRMVLRSHIASALRVTDRYGDAIYQPDDRYGYVLAPGVTDWERVSGRTAVYTIDADGHRSTPAPARPTRRVVVIGDSFTFGADVNDDEPYPARLAQAWPSVRVINMGVSAWGLTQFALAVTDALAETPPPDAILIGMIAHDLERSYLRAPWPPWPPPHAITHRLEWVEGAFTPSRLLVTGDPAPETPSLRETEARMNIELLEMLIHACRDRHVPLAVIQLTDGLPIDLATRLVAERVPVLALSNERYDTLLDGHPSPAGHRTIAHAITTWPALWSLGFDR